MSIYSFMCFKLFIWSFFLLNLFFSYYSASLDEAQEEIVKLINEDKWNTNEFSDMKKDLLNKLKIQQN